MGNKPRILFVNHTADISGPTYSLIAMLPYLRERFEPAVYVPERGYLSRWLEQEGIQEINKPDLELRSMGKFYQMIRREKFDLVYGNNPSSYSRRAILAAKLAGIPVVWHFRGVKWHWNWRKGVFLPLTNCVIAVSNACARSLARFYPLEKMRIVYNGVEIHPLHADRSQSRRCLLEEFGLPENARILIMVSHVNPRKGQVKAIQAMTYLLQKYRDVHLLIAGSLNHNPSYVEEIRELITQQSLSANIHLLGLRNDIPLLLAGSDIFLHTATADAHPRAVIEGMAASLPVVSFSVDGVAETVLDGITGFLVPPDDCQGMAESVRTLLEDPALAHTYGRQGRLRVEQHFSASGTASKIEGILSELL